jgi:tripartite-type tricarboxylate transporter receptor subunit TctC
MITAPTLSNKLGYDPIKSFAPIAMTFSAPQVLTINPTIPARSVAALVAHAKANPGKIHFASPGLNAAALARGGSNATLR